MRSLEDSAPVKLLSPLGAFNSICKKGKRVATNLDLDLSELVPLRSKVCSVRLSDFPTITDLNIIGRGHYVEDKKCPANRFARGYSAATKINEVVYSKQEKNNGLLVLDECNVFFNSRDWNDKRRMDVIAWLRHARKLGWDVIFIMQDLQAVDKQIRIGLIEHEGVCKRADRLSIPFVGGLLRAVGLGFLSRPPRIHVCSVKYGLSQHALVVDRWIYRGHTVQNGYDTNQVFTEHDATNSVHVGVHSVLSPWHTHGRHISPPVFQLLKMWLKGEVWRPYIVLKTKHPVVELLQKIPEPQRLHHWKRLEASSKELESVATGTSSTFNAAATAPPISAALAPIPVPLTGTTTPVGITTV